MTRRFWISVALTLPPVVLEMSDMIPGQPVQRLMPASMLTWIELALATPVVLWAGWPPFVRGWQSIVNRSLKMFTLIGMGVGVVRLQPVRGRLPKFVSGFISRRRRYRAGL